MRALRALFMAAIAILVSSGVAHAASGSLTSSAFLRMPSRFMSSQLSLSSRGLGETCYSRDLMPDGTVCNPAFADEVKSGFLMGRVFLGNGYAAVTSANQLLFQPVSKEFLLNLFRRQNVISLEGNASLIFGTKYFSASFSPYRVQYFSEIHNPNYAVVGIQASVERALELQGGAPIDGLIPALKGVSVGGKLRLIDRTYVNGSFSIAQVIAAEDSRSVLPVKQQYAAYLDPTVAWRGALARWKISASATAVNVGKISSDDPVYDSPLDLALGFGVEPPVKYGRLRLGLDFVSVVRPVDGAGSIPRFGGSYRLGVLEGLVGWHQNAITGGMLFGFEILQAGIVYEFMRSELEGGFSDNRISTELSVRL